MTTPPFFQEDELVYVANESVPELEGDALYWLKLLRGLFQKRSQMMVFGFNGIRSHARLCSGMMQYIFRYSRKENGSSNKFRCIDSTRGL